MRYPEAAFAQRLELVRQFQFEVQARTRAPDCPLPFESGYRMPRSPKPDLGSFPGERPIYSELDLTDVGSLAAMDYRGEIARERLLPGCREMAVRAQRQPSNLTSPTYQGRLWLRVVRHLPVRRTWPSTAGLRAGVGQASREETAGHSRGGGRLRSYGDLSARLELDGDVGAGRRSSIDGAAGKY